MDTSGWDIRAHSTQRDVVTVHARRHTFRVGAPIHFDVEYDEVSALEYALGALAADVLGSFRSLAHRRRLDVDHVEALVHGELGNPLMFLGVIGESGDPGISQLRVKCYVSSLDEQDRVRAVWDEALARSPLARTFTAAGKLEISMQVVI